MNTALDRFTGSDEEVVRGNEDEGATEPTLDEIIADMDARGWCYEIDNFHVNSAKSWAGWYQIRRSDVGINIYREVEPGGERVMLANVFGHGSLAEGLRMAYESAIGPEPTTAPAP